MAVRAPPDRGRRGSRSSSHEEPDRDERHGNQHTTADQGGAWAPARPPRAGGSAPTAPSRAKIAQWPRRPGRRTAGLAMVRSRGSGARSNPSTATRASNKATAVQIHASRVRSSARAGVGGQVVPLAVDTAREARDGTRNSSQWRSRNGIVWCGENPGHAEVPQHQPETGAVWFGA